jgi:DHA2 family multidrug resistance protein
MIFATVSFMRAGFDTEVDTFHLLVPTIIQGAAMASFFLPLVALTLSGLPPERIAAASGLSNFVRIMAGGMGASLVTTMWDHRSILHHAYLTENVSRYSSSTGATVSALGQGGFTGDQSVGLLERMLDSQAHMMGANDVFYGSGMIFLVLVFVIWMAKPERSSKPVDAGGAH